MKTELYKVSVMAMLIAAALPASAETVDLTGLGYVTYGDAQSYSMPIANYQYGYNTNNGPFAISSTPGQISSLTVLGTGSDGNPVTDNFSGMDNAYATPTGRGGETFFYANTATYQGTQGTVNTNGDNTWDTSLAALQTFLAGDALAVFFNNNQEKSSGTAAESLAAWGRVWLTDASGEVIDNSTFEFTNNDKPYALTTQGGGGKFGGDTNYIAPGSGAGGPSSASAGTSDFVLSGGSICVATGGSLTVPVPVACDSDPKAVGGTTISAPIDHNLGADHVAYVLLFPELNILLDSLFAKNLSNLSDYTMHVDMRLGCNLKATTVDDKGNDVYDPNTSYGVSFTECGAVNGWGTGLNNGYEQIFLGTAKVGVCPPGDPLCNPTVPEPGSLALLGVGLGLLGWRVRRQKRVNG